jgi:hypothetical protein
MRFRLLFLSAGLFFSLAVLRANATLIAQLNLQSQPGDFIGQGQTVNITYPESQIIAQIVATTPGGLPDYVQFILGVASPTNTDSTLQFATNQLGIPLAPGVYTDAQRAAFATAGHPGLDVTFQNRGSNTLTGLFTINNASFYANNTKIASFSVTFEQHSEGATPALFGTLTFTDTAVVPEPASVAFVGVGSLLLLFVSRRAPRA